MTFPGSLYKYRAFNAYSLSSLANQSIWLAKPKSFNDPFDCAITLDRTLYRESILHAVSVIMERVNSGELNEDELRKEWPRDKEAFEKFREGLRATFQNMGVCSFSASSDALLLWSQRVLYRI